MSNETAGLLGEALAETLRTASLDEEVFDPIIDLPGNPQSKEECVQLVIDFYRENREAVDSAILAAQKVLGSPDGAAQVEALTASAKTGQTGLDVSELITDDELSPLTDAALSSGLEALSIGVAAEASAVVGRMAGDDWVVPLGGGSTYSRPWGAGSLGPDISASAGIVFGFWDKKPDKADIAGFVIDVGWPLTGALPVPFPFGVRFMYIGKLGRQASDDIKGSVTKTHLGVTLQLGVGVGAGFASFLGRQMGGAELKATMTVLNDDNIASVTQGTDTPLNVTIKTYPGSNITLEEGTTIKLTMPLFFSQNEVAAMTIDLEGWSFSSSGSQLTLTLNSAQGVWTDPITFTIDNVVCSSGDDPGHVGLSMDGTSLGYTIYAKSKLTAVAQVAAMTIDWQGHVDGTNFNWESGSATSGTGVKVYTAPKNTLQPLATAVQNNRLETEWTLGYECQYNTVNGESVAQISAIIKNSSGTIKYQGTWTQAGTESAPTQTNAYYANQPGGEMWLEITNIVVQSE